MDKDSLLYKILDGKLTGHATGHDALGNSSSTTISDALFKKGYKKGVKDGEKNFMLLMISSNIFRLFGPKVHKQVMEYLDMQTKENDTNTATIAQPNIKFYIEIIESILHLLPLFDGTRGSIMNEIHEGVAVFEKSMREKQE